MLQRSKFHACNLLATFAKAKLIRLEGHAAYVERAWSELNRNVTPFNRKRLGLGCV